MNHSIKSIVQSLLLFYFLGAITVYGQTAYPQVQKKAHPRLLLLKGEETQIDAAAGAYQ